MGRFKTARRQAEEPSLPAPASAEVPDVMAQLLALEGPAKDLAANWPDEVNCDAIKAALRNASHGIAHVRKVLAQQARRA